MQYAISISYKYTISELCILLYPFGLHRLPAQPHQSRSTGHGNAWTRSDSTGADEAPAPEATHGRKDTETAPAAEPPQRSSPEAKRQKSQSQHDGSSGDKTAQQTLSPTRASPAPTDTDSSRNAAFFGSAFVEYAESTEINASFDHTEGGDGSYFHDLTNAKNLALYPLLHASIFFTKPSSHKHTVHQRYISLQI